MTYLDYRSCFSHSCMNLFMLNIHSLRKKLNLLEAEMARLGWPKVVILPESWLEPGTEDYYHISGYRDYHITRPDGYGGLSVYVQDHTRHSFIRSRSCGADAVQIISIRFLDLDFDLHAIYRRPDERNLMGFFCGTG